MEERCRQAADEAPGRTRRSADEALFRDRGRQGNPGIKIGRSYADRSTGRMKLGFRGADVWARTHQLRWEDQWNVLRQIKLREIKTRRSPARGRFAHQGRERVLRYIELLLQGWKPSAIAVEL